MAFFRRTLCSPFYLSVGSPRLTEVSKVHGGCWEYTTAKGKRRAGGRTAEEEARDDEDGLCHFCFAEGRGSAAAPVAAAAPVDSDVRRLPPRPAFRPAARRWGEMNAWEDAATSYLDQGLL